MTTIALNAEKQRELDEETRRAWSNYSERLRELHGEEYAEAEDACWTELQDQLSRLADQRRQLAEPVS